MIFDKQFFLNHLNDKEAHMGCLHVGCNVFDILYDAISKDDATEVARLEDLIRADEAIRKELREGFENADDERAQVVFFNSGPLLS